MHEYHDLLRRIRAKGEWKDNRTGTRAKSLFGDQIRIDLTKGFPLITTKKVHFKSVVHELLWMLSGSTNVKDLQKHGVTIWDEWANEAGELGPVYGAQWRTWGAYTDITSPYDVLNTAEYKLTSVDQIKRVEQSIKDDPYSRRHIVTAWNPSEIERMALPPCHMMFQFNVEPPKPDWNQSTAQFTTPMCGTLSCHVYMRSCDAFLGLPFNIASYALLTQMMACVCDLRLGNLIISFGDLHIYENHRSQFAEQINRDPSRYKLPTVTFNRRPESVTDFRFEDIELVGYEHYPALPAEVAI